MLKNYKIIIIILLLLSALAYFFNLAQGPGEVITLYPEEGETKIKPADAGGIVMPGAGNLIYETLKTQGKSNIGIKSIYLLPEPEQPINIGYKIDEESGDPIGAILAKTSIEEALSHKASSIIDTKNLLKSTDAEDYIAALIEESGPPLTQEKSLKVVKVQQGSSILLSEKQSGNSSKRYKLQLASVKTETEGQVVWQRLQSKFPKILGKLNMQLKKVKRTNGSIFYLLQAGNYNTLNAAKVTCKKLSNAGQSCIPVN